MITEELQSKLCPQCGGILMNFWRPLQLSSTRPLGDTYQGVPVTLCYGHPKLIDGNQENIQSTLRYLVDYYKGQAIETLQYAREAIDAQSMQERINQATCWEMKHDAVIQIALDLGIDLEEGAPAQEPSPCAHTTLESLPPTRECAYRLRCLLCGKQADLIFIGSLSFCIADVIALEFGEERREWAAKHCRCEQHRRLRERDESC